MSYLGVGEIGGSSGAFSYTHSNVPYLGTPVSRNKIKSLMDARVYAAGGFHASVTQALREKPTSNHYKSWQAAADEYYKVYKKSFGDTALSSLLASLTYADNTAAAAPRVVRDEPPVNPSQPSNPNPISPNAGVPSSEQISESDPYGGTFIMGMSVYTLALLAVGAMFVFPMLKGKKGRKKR
jgi:hypothetical protein